MHVCAIEGDEERTGGGRHPLISHAHTESRGAKRTRTYLPQKDPYIFMIGTRTHARARARAHTHGRLLFNAVCTHIVHTINLYTQAREVHGDAECAGEVSALN